MPLPAASRVVTQAQGIALERRRRGNDLEWNELQRKAQALEQSWVPAHLVEVLGVERAHDELLAPTIAAGWRRQQEPGWVDPEQAMAAARQRARAEADWQRGFAELQERAARPCGYCHACRIGLRCAYG